MGTLSVDKILKTSTGAAEFTLPATDGTAGQVWQTDGSGQLSLANYTGPIATDAITATQIAANAVTTTEIIDNAVTGAKIAMGSDVQGDVLYYNGTDYVRLGAGTSGQHLQTGGAGANPSWVAAPTGGLTDINQWRLNADFANTANPITGATIVEVTTDAVGKIGDGMTYDSGTGVFTFPQTGIWVIDANFYYWQNGNGGGAYGTTQIQITENNSSYSVSVEARTSDYYSAYGEMSLKWVFDVSDITTHKCRFAVVQGLAAAVTKGSTTENKTYFTFSRVGAT